MRWAGAVDHEFLVVSEGAVTSERAVASGSTRACRLLPQEGHRAPCLWEMKLVCS